jgi:hypothetical protein
LLDKRLNEDKHTPVAQPLRRAHINLDESLQDMLIDLFNGDRHCVTINTTLIEGMLKTDKRIEINITITDGDES